MINLNIEQKEIINSIKNGYNIIVDAVAGCGKTTTSLAIAQECTNKNILILIRYNFMPDYFLSISKAYLSGYIYKYIELGIQRRNLCYGLILYLKIF